MEGQMNLLEMTPDQRFASAVVDFFESNNVIMWARDDTRPGWCFTVLRENKGAVQPYVTHRGTIMENGEPSFSFGHYFENKEEAILSFIRRTLNA